ncbi:MAG: ShlB/FhaC/HecB family hemolysin secretion/activation protein, partial [Gammaproteobacteria bacterium]|nr:ShlB/FhaC/HecB family hemolysin secretion/activation protein [Gammaproteobacteria bacterium]
MTVDMHSRMPPPHWGRTIALCCALWLATATAVCAQAETEPRFDVWEFEVSGNTVLERRVIEKTVYPFLGPARTVAEVEEARQALERLYRDSGYGTVVVTIPEQDVEQGLVRLAVIEGQVDRLIVSGANYFSPELIKDAVPSLAPGNVPELPRVQKELQALNAATSDRRITPVLRPGRSPGTLEAELKVDDDLPIHGSFEVNNAYTRDTTRTRVAASLSYDNLWQRQHSALIGYQTAPEDTDDVSVLFGTYTARWFESPWLVSGYLVDSDSDVASVGTLGVIGKGTIAGLRFIRPLPPLAGGFQRITIGLDHKDFDESIALTGNQPS